MAAIGPFNANDVKPNQFEAIPAAKYIAAIVGSEMKPTKDGTGKMLELKFQILEGQYQNRTLFSRLNLENLSDVAVKIARGDLSAICRAVNIMEPKDSIDLHNLPLSIKVTQKKGDDGETRNEIKGYEAKSVGAPSSIPATKPTTPPWQKKA